MSVVTLQACKHVTLIPMRAQVLPFTCHAAARVTLPHVSRCRTCHTATCEVVPEWTGHFAAARVTLPHVSRCRTCHGCMFKCIMGVIFKLFLLANQKPRNVLIRIPILLYFMGKTTHCGTCPSVELNRNECIAICNPFWITVGGVCSFVFIYYLT